MKTYVVSDIHGRYDLLVQAVKRIEESSHTGGIIVFTGDYVDRGVESMQVIDFLMKGPTEPDRWQWVFLMGNHEDMMYRSCRYGSDTNLWVMNGGGQTLLSYGQKQGDHPTPGIVPSDVVEWLSSLNWYYEDEHRIYVHAGVMPDTDMKDQDLNTLIWMRYGDYEPESLEWGHKSGKHVIYGHNPFEDGPKYFKNRTDMDTMAFYTGRLVVGCFDDDTPGAPKSTIEILGPTLKDVYADWRALHPKEPKPE